MQSEKKEEVKKEMTFPGLYESKETGHIYLLQTASSGVRVFTGNLFATNYLPPLGAYCAELSATWVPYEGSITLRN